MAYELKVAGVSSRRLAQRLAPAAELEKVERERQQTENSVLDLLTTNPTGEKEEDERDGRRFEPHPQSSSVARSPLLRVTALFRRLNKWTLRAPRAGLPVARGSSPRR